MFRTSCAAGFRGTANLAGFARNRHGADALWPFMYIEALNRHLAVCSFDGAVRLTNSDKGYWNVVSICGPRQLRADLRLAKRTHFACFDDVEDGCSPVYRQAKASDIADIFAFIETLVSGPANPPLLFHCQQGISRSAAVALSWIYGQMPRTDGCFKRSIDIILKLRPEARPNRLVLTLGLAQFMATDEATRLANRMLADPRFAPNRFETLK